MQTLHIDVKGRTGSGKSTVAAMIKAHFDQIGLECEIVEGEIDASVTAEEWVERMQALKGHKLKIFTIHDEASEILEKDFQETPKTD